jgi:type II secretory pathway pseudopilin PulG
MLVIMILAGLMLKMGAYIRDSALQNQAQSELNAIAGAISAYAADHGYARPPDPLYQALLMGPKKYLDWPAARILPGSSVGNSTGLLDPWGGLYSYKAGRGDTPGHDPSAGGGNMFKTGDMMLYLGTSGAPSGQNVGRWYSVIAGSNMGDTHHF